MTPEQINNIKQLSKPLITVYNQCAVRELGTANNLVFINVP